MELIKQILASFADTLPNDSKTAAAIARGAGPEEISACASEEGLHALAGALFEASQEGGGQGGLPLDSTASVTGALAGRLKEFRQQLPASCETARLIDGGASLEEISEAAQKEGLTSLASMLFEAEQEADRDS
ncbi:MAG TPA: hypothetical protein VER68_11005 [Azonexus sp.]|jgi:hypothetical protein|nr:hypothetical protein [Azonexus sp.]